jgi:hypothetical protein
MESSVNQGLLNASLARCRVPIDRVAPEARSANLSAICGKHALASIDRV